MPELPPGFELETLPQGFQVESTPTSEKAKRPVAESKTEQPGVLDTILRVYGTPFKWLAGGAELAAATATGAAGEVAGGLAGIAGAVLPGETDQSKRWLEATQQAMQYEPRGEVAQGAIELIGKGGQFAQENIPYVKEVLEVPRYLGRAGQEAGRMVGGPGSMSEAIGGTVGESAVPMALELIGMKGSMAAKKAVLKEARMVAGAEKFYDEATGVLKPEIKQGLQDAGIKLEDVSDILPENIQGKTAAKKPIETIAAAGQAKPRQKSIISKVVEEVRPDPVVIDAAREFGVLEDIPASWASTNPTYQAIEQGLKIPGSAVTETERIAIGKLNNTAQDLIREFGGTTEKSQLSGQFRADSIDLIHNFEKEAENLYKKVNQMIEPNMPAIAPKTLEKLEEMAARKVIGGDIEIGKKRIPKTASDLLIELQQPDITYDYLDSLRREIGDGLNKKTGRFKDESSGLLKMLYRNLTKDQEALITDPEALATFKLAKANVAQRKAIEEQLKKVIGKDIEGDIAETAKQAVLAMQSGRTKEFEKLSSNIPKELGAETRRRIFATSLIDVMTQGSRKERYLNMPGFDDFMTGLKRETPNYIRFQKEIGKENMDRLSRFHDLIHAGRVAMAKEITTGKALTVPKVMDEIKTVSERIYGIVEPVEKIPGGGIVGKLLNIKETPKSVAADKLLGSSKFRNLMMQKAQGKIDSPAKVANVDGLINKLKEFQAWKKTLSQGELNELIQVGPIGYLTTSIFPPGEETP